MDHTPDIVCVGHIVQEMISFPDGKQGPFLGSPPAYCSVAAARQGAAAAVVTKVGRDMPKDLLKPFGEAGVDTAGIRICGKTTATELVYDGRGNKEIRYPSKAAPIRATDVPKAYHGCGILYVCTMDTDVPVEELGAVTALGHVRAVDLGGYGGVHMSKAHREATASLAALACDVAAHFDIVKASDEDAAAIFGWNNPNVAARKLLDCGPSIVVVTLGPQGALVFSGKKRRAVRPFPAHVRDTTGGGDTFMAGFLCEYLCSEDPVRAAQWGAATAACVIEQSGGVRVERMPTREQVSIRLSQSTPKMSNTKNQEKGG